MKTASKQKVIKFLLSLLGETWFVRDGGEFDRSHESAIWTTNEETHEVLDGGPIYDTWGMTNHPYEVHPVIKEGLDKLGWYIEPYDSGTLMIYPI